MHIFSKFRGFSLFIIPDFSWWSYSATTIFPFIFLQEKYFSLKGTIQVQRLINHENIHIQQQIELGIFGFYLLYFLEFLVRLIIFRKWKKAYYTISFEVEAYFKQSNLDYLQKRKRYFWVSYIFQSNLWNVPKKYL